MKNKCKPLMISLLSVLAAVFMVKVALATDCRVPSVERISGPGFKEDYKVIFDISSIEYASHDNPFLEGQMQDLDMGWGFYEEVVYIGNGYAKAIIRNWPSGTFIEFSTGVMAGGVSFYTKPNVSCTKYYYKGHYRVKLGEKYIQPPGEKVAAAVLSPFLMKSGMFQPPAPHSCIVMGIEETSISGPFGDYRIVLSRQKFEQNTPSDAVPVVDRQTYPDNTWSGFQFIQALGPGKALIEVNNWPRGWDMEFSYAQEHTGTNYWPDWDEWGQGCLDEYYYNNSHLKVTLGTQQTCSHANTNDELVVGINYRGGDVYRLRLDFTRLPIYNYQRIFLWGQSSPNGSWIMIDVNDNYPCYWVDVYWPSDSIFEFTYCVDREDGSRTCVHPSGEFLYNNGNDEHLGIQLRNYQ